jgi:hypothetical protein
MKPSVEEVSQTAAIAVLKQSSAAHQVEATVMDCKVLCMHVLSVHLHY